MATVSDSGKSNPGGRGSLKVYGWRGYRQGLPGGGKHSQQSREIMAAKSVAEVLRATGMSRGQFNHDGCETHNPEELALALAEPGVILTQSIYAKQGSNWMRENGSMVPSPVMAGERLTKLIAFLEWQIRTMRENPSNRIADRVTVNARDLEALISSAKAVL